MKFTIDGQNVKLKKGKFLKVVANNEEDSHEFKIGDEVEYIGYGSYGYYLKCKRKSDGLVQKLTENEVSLIK